MEINLTLTADELDTAFSALNIATHKLNARMGSATNDSERDRISAELLAVRRLESQLENELIAARILVALNTAH